MIPSKKEAKGVQAKGNHSQYIKMFDYKPIYLNDIVHRAAYWGNSSDFILEDKPKIDEDSRLFDPTIVLQYIMLSKYKYMWVVSFHSL